MPDKASPICSAPSRTNRSSSEELPRAQFSSPATGTPTQDRTSPVRRLPTCGGGTSSRRPDKGLWVGGAHGKGKQVPPEWPLSHVLSAHKQTKPAPNWPAFVATIPLVLYFHPGPNIPLASCGKYFRTSKLCPLLLDRFGSVSLSPRLLP